MKHKTIHTYGKRGSRGRKSRSTSAADSTGDSSDDASWRHNGADQRSSKGSPSITSHEDTASSVACLTFVATSSSARPALVPEVVIYSAKPRRHRSCTSDTLTTDNVKTQSASNDLSRPMLAGMFRDATVKSDIKGKARMREPSGGVHKTTGDLDATLCTTKEESNCVCSPTTLLYAMDLKRTAETDVLDVDFPNSQASALPRRSTKRSREKSSDAFEPIMKSDRFSDSSIASGSVKQKNPRPEQRTSSFCRKRPPLRTEDSMDSLFDDLMKDEIVPSVPSHPPSNSCEDSRLPLQGQMLGRPHLSSASKASLARVPGTSASPVRLQRTDSAINRVSSPHSIAVDSEDFAVLGAFQGAGSSLAKLASEDDPCLQKSLKQDIKSLAESPFPKHIGSGASQEVGVASQSPRGTWHELLEGNAAPSPHRRFSRQGTPDATVTPLSDSSSDSATVDQSGKNAIVHSRLHLRSTGESRRFEDEMNYHLDGLALGQTPAVHRASSVDILSKMRDEDFIRKLKVYDFVPRLYAAFRQVGAGDGDTVLDIVLLLFLYTVCTDRPTIDSIVEAGSLSLAGLLEVLSHLNERPWLRKEISAAHGTGSKAEKRHLLVLGEYCLGIVQRTEDSTSMRPCNSRFLLIRVVTALCQFLPQALEDLSAANFLHSLLRGVLEVMQNTVDPSSDQADTRQLSASLQLLHILSSQAAESKTTAARIAELGSTSIIVALAEVVAVAAQLFPRPRLIGERGGDLVCSLRILINLVEGHLLLKLEDGAIRSLLMSLTNCINSIWACHPGNPARVESSEEDSTELTAEALLVALGLLQMTMECSTVSRTIYQSIRIKSYCSAACGTRCGCDLEIPASILVCRIYLAGLSEESSAEAQIIAGYASLILLYGSFGNPVARDSVVQNIQKYDEAVKFLHNAVNELLALHAQAVELGVDASQTLAGDLKSMRTRLQEASGVPSHQVATYV